MTSNPWLRHVEATDDAPDAEPGRVSRPTGPATPQAGVTAPDQVDQLPVRDQPVPARLWVVGVHGGAGETTLARLIPGARSAGRAWPRLPATSYTRTPVLLVARSHVAGLEAARRAATHWASGAVGDVDLLGLVIVADAPGRLPRPLRDLAAHVAGAPPRTWRMPWVEAWRLGQDLDLNTSPGDVRRLIGEISSLLPPQTSAASAGH